MATFPPLDGYLMAALMELHRPLQPRAGRLLPLEKEQERSAQVRRESPRLLPEQSGCGEEACSGTGYSQTAPGAREQGIKVLVLSLTEPVDLVKGLCPAGP